MGLLINGVEVTKIELGGVEVLRIEDGQGNVLYEAYSGPDYLCFTSNQDGSYLYGNGMGSLSIECSTDRVNWTAWDWESRTNLDEGEKIYLRGTNPNGIDASFTLRGSIAASGDLTTLIHPDGGVTTLPTRCFWQLFEGETALTSAPHLDSVTTVGQWALAGTFDGCTGLVAAPDLRNVTSVGSYGCTSLYNGCTALRTIYAPSITTWNTTDFTGWVTGIGGSGVMWKPAALSIPNGNDGKPSGWSTQDYPA